MSKVLCYSGIATAGMLLILFSLDLAIGVPFKKADTLMDIVFLISSTVRFAPSTAPSMDCSRPESGSRITSSSSRA